MYLSEFCDVRYEEKHNVVLVEWKKFCCYEDYRKPLEYALDVIKKHMPITEDEIGDIGDAVDEIMDLINSELTNYMEIYESEDITESVLCYECGEESVCINEDLLPVGTCTNCGYVNSVYECDRCQLWFNSDEEGRVFDDIAFCQNCLDEYEEE